MEQPRVLEVEPTADSYYYLATIHLRMENYEHAVVAYRRCLELKPDSRNARYFLAYSLARLNDYEASIIEIAKLHGTWKEQALLALSIFKYHAVPVAIMWLLD